MKLVAFLFMAAFTTSAYMIGAGPKWAQLSIFKVRGRKDPLLDYHVGSRNLSNATCKLIEN